MNARVFISTTGQGLARADCGDEVWHSADYGDTWQPLPFNLTSIHRSLIMLW